MSRHSATTDPTLAKSLPIYRLMAIAMLLLVAVSSGCSRLRLPAIDPTGSRIFSPLPTTTTLALPESFGCLSRLGDCLHRPRLGTATTPQFVLPQPAFPEPATPPRCLTPGRSIASGASNEPCVPSAPCAGDCQNGPPAVLFGDECKLKNRRRLPTKGTRGCILLSPDKIVAPVGGEVVLLSGVCGNDGYLQMNERLEWMLTPESVGTFIQVGDDDPGLLHKLVGSKKQPEKHDPSYAHGLTSTKRTLITRGNLDARDDVQLEKGQTWITISSPSEGTSRVTVLAPESECWDQRKATATIYWIDARWQFPGPQIVQAGQSVNLTTRVTRAEGSIPAQGWKVRYEILQPELATFAGTNGSSVVEAIVDESGNAAVQLLPIEGTSGTAAIDMQVIRPSGQSDNMPMMTLGRGQTFVTWSSPKLVLRAGAPEVATFDVPVQVVINVSNPGDQAATNVRVDVPIPAGATVTGVDSFATSTPGAVIWEIGTIPPQQQLDLFMNIATKTAIQLPFQATGDGLRAEDTVRIDVFQPALDLKVAPERDRYEAGQSATFNIDVTNTSDRPLQNVVLTVTGDEAMVHEQGGRVKENEREQPLQPGETWAVAVTFVPTQAGQRCINVQSTAAGGQIKSQDSCVTVLNPIPPAQSLSATLESRDRIGVNDTSLFRARIANTGEVEQRNVRVTMVNDPQLRIVGATEDGLTQASGNLIIWTIPSLAPNQSIVLEGQYQAVAVNPRARVALSAEAAEGTADDTDIFVEIVNTAAPAPGPAPLALPPAQPDPVIPGGPGTTTAPLQGAPGGPVAPPLPERSNRIKLGLFGRDNPVAVNAPMRYSLSVVNDSNERDGQVLIQFQLPDGVKLDRVNPVLNPELGQYQNNAGVISLPLIRSMNPGEAIDYEIVLISNQPQTIDLNVQARSLRTPDGVTISAQTDVR